MLLSLLIHFIWLWKQARVEAMWSVFFCVWHLWIDGWENNSNNQFSLSWEIARRVRKVFFFNQKNPFFGLRHPSLSCHSKQVVVGRKIEFFMCCCRILKSFHYIVLVLVKGERKKVSCTQHALWKIIFLFMKPINSLKRVHNICSDNI